MIRRSFSTLFTKQGVTDSRPVYSTESLNYLTAISSGVTDIEDMYSKVRALI